MNIQGFMDRMNEMECETRSKYHLTLGGLIEALAKPGLPAKTVVLFDTGQSPDPDGFDSYRGYYIDVALDTRAETTTVGELAIAAQAAVNATFTGYKGGDYPAHPNKPLWLAEYGCTGRAIVGIHLDAIRDVVVLETKEVR